MRWLLNDSQIKTKSKKMLDRTLNQEIPAIDADRSRTYRNLAFSDQGLSGLVTGEIEIKVRSFIRSSEHAQWQPNLSESRFDLLANMWRTETTTMSLEHDVVLHPAYQEIIGMGAVALPYIFRELEERPALWFWALRAITNENPISSSQEGDVEAMRKSWLVWAHKNIQLLDSTMSSAMIQMAYA